VDIGFIDQGHGVGRKIVDQPIDVRLLGDRGGGIVRVDDVNQATARLLGRGHHLANIGGVIARSQGDFDHRESVSGGHIHRELIRRRARDQRNFRRGVGGDGRVQNLAGTAADKKLVSLDALGLHDGVRKVVHVVVVIAPAAREDVRHRLNRLRRRTIWIFVAIQQHYIAEVAALQFPAL
jgi:hypothetical protein